MEINVNLPDHRYTLTIEKGLLQDVGNWVKKNGSRNVLWW